MIHESVCVCVCVCARSCVCVHMCAYHVCVCIWQRISVDFLTGMWKHNPLIFQFVTQLKQTFSFFFQILFFLWFTSAWTLLYCMLIFFHHTTLHLPYGLTFICSSHLCFTWVFRLFHPDLDSWHRTIELEKENPKPNWQNLYTLCSIDREHNTLLKRERKKKKACCEEG